MQLNTKNTILVLLLGFSSICFYYGFRGEDTLRETNIQKQIVSSEIVETDTGKRLETFSNSGTDWGMTPFGSGKPLEEAEEEKLKFVKPNTEWKTRTLNINGQWLTYEFGKGNPSEVALPESEMKGCSWQEAGIPECTDNGAGYVDATLEELVFNLLSSADWGVLLQNCKNDFLTLDTFLQIGDNPYPITYDTLLNLGRYISLEEIFVINPQTGRKNISKDAYIKLTGLYGYIQMATDTYNQSGLGEPLPGITKCVDTYGVDIAKNLINIRWLPWRGSQDIPISQGGWDGKIAPIEQSF